MNRISLWAPALTRKDLTALQEIVWRLDIWAGMSDVDRMEPFGDQRGPLPLKPTAIKKQVTPNLLPHLLKKDVGRFAKRNKKIYICGHLHCQKYTYDCKYFGIFSAYGISDEANISFGIQVKGIALYKRHLIGYHIIFLHSINKKYYNYSPNMPVFVIVCPRVKQIIKKRNIALKNTCIRVISSWIVTPGATFCHRLGSKTNQSIFQLKEMHLHDTAI